MVKSCVVCGDAIWYREGHLCQKHRFAHVQMALTTHWFDLRLQVSDGKRGDFERVSHREAQLMAMSTRPRPWWVDVGDVLRVHGHWLDDYGGCAA